MRQMITFNDPGLYAVYVGEMIGQFSDGYWENSRHNDWKLFGYNNVCLSETLGELPKIRYNINGFFSNVKKEALDCIIVRVLMLYRFGNLVKKAYMEKGKDEADLLISALESIEYAHHFREWKYEEKIRVVNKYFGSMENFISLTPEVNKESIKEFTRIGKMLHNSFKHVRSFYY